MMHTLGIITEIQDLCVHDGPGLRSLVFLKGCHLRCRWCQNPECLIPYPQVAFKKSFCINCGKCVNVCPKNAISMDKENKINREKCTNCLKCAEVCTSGALYVIGRWITSYDLFKELEKYQCFYGMEGGVTFTGGSPLFQPKFLIETIKLCKRAGIHTAIEVEGFSDIKTLIEISELSDLILFDIKHLDPEKHRRGTGKSNELILKNFKHLCERLPKGKVIVRIPLIPGFNDDEDTVIKIAKFIPLSKVDKIDLLPFNPLAAEKYEALGQKWEYLRVKPQSYEYSLRLKKDVESLGFTVTIGGLW